MNEETIDKLADLLRRRKAQRVYLAGALVNEEKQRVAITNHREEINKIQRQLLDLGYTGQ